MRRLVGMLATIVAACVLSGCHPARTNVLSATSEIDARHKLSITATLEYEGGAPAGLTPLEVEVKDAMGRPVRDAVVYVDTGSTTSATPIMTIVAPGAAGVYRADLPLVHGSHWLFTIKAYSQERMGILMVHEQVE